LEDLDEQDLMNLFSKIWIQNVGDIDFNMIFVIENSNKFQKTKFWKEKSVEDVVTRECLPFSSSRRNCDVSLVSLERSCNGI